MRQTSPPPLVPVGGMCSPSPLPPDRVVPPPAAGTLSPEDCPALAATAERTAGGVVTVTLVANPAARALGGCGSQGVPSAITYVLHLGSEEAWHAWNAAAVLAQAAELSKQGRSVRVMVVGEWLALSGAGAGMSAPLSFSPHVLDVQAAHEIQALPDHLDDLRELCEGVGLPPGALEAAVTAAATLMPVQPWARSTVCVGTHMWPPWNAKAEDVGGSGDRLLALPLAPALQELRAQCGDTAQPPFCYRHECMPTHSHLCVGRWRVDVEDGAGGAGLGGGAGGGSAPGPLVLPPDAAALVVTSFGQVHAGARGQGLPGVFAAAADAVGATATLVLGRAHDGAPVLNLGFGGKGLVCGDVVVWGVGGVLPSTRSVTVVLQEVWGAASTARYRTHAVAVHMPRGFAGAPKDVWYIPVVDKSGEPAGVPASVVHTPRARRQVQVVTLLQAAATVLVAALTCHGTQAPKPEVLTQARAVIAGAPTPLVRAVQVAYGLTHTLPWLATHVDTAGPSVLLGALLQLLRPVGAALLQGGRW
jgi:hypothetical protein